MTTHTGSYRPEPQGPPPSSAAAQRLDRLEAALREALAMEAGLPDAVRQDLTRQVADLTRMVASIRPEEVDACLEKLRRVRRVHDQLSLRVRQENQETAAQLAQLRKGRQTLRAYRQGT